VNALIALGIGVCVAAAVAVGAAAFSPARGAPQAWRPSHGGARRAIGALVAGIVALALTGWLLAGVGAALVVIVRRQLFGSARAGKERRRVEAIALWLEGLRDALSSDASLQTVLLKLAESPPSGIADEMTMFERRCRHGVPLADALWQLGRDVAHPTADIAVATMMQSLELAGAKLRSQLHELAVTARHELAMRERVDRIRARFEGATKAMVAIGAVIVVYLRFVGTTLNYYRSASGQAVLAVPFGLWAITFWWLRMLSRYDLPGRTLTRRPEAVA